MIILKLIKTVELFAGVGGFRLGLEEASNKFKVIWANQWEPSMREQYGFDCYTKHFGKSEKHVCEDIAIAKKYIPNHDLLVGGFPCQDYSIMKKHSLGIEGQKGALWWQIDSIVREKRPKYILLENVDRLISSPASQLGRDFSVILRCLYESGYAVEWRIVNASDYGCAQRRRRVFILAIYKDTAIYKLLTESVCANGLKSMHKYVMEYGVFAKAFPIKDHKKVYTDNWIDEIKYENVGTVLKHQKVRLYNTGVMVNGRIYSVDVESDKEKFIPIKSIQETEMVDEHYFLKEEDMKKWMYAKGAKKELRVTKDGRRYYFTEGSVKFPEDLNLPSRTILTSESQVGRTSHVVKDLLTGRLRTLTPVECERLNGFPDGWTDTGMPEKMRYFCMGNALVVPLIVRIAKTLENVISIT